MSGNFASIVGNVTRTDIKYTPSGAAVFEFGVACNRRWPDKQKPGEWREETSFFDCTAWGELAENASDSIEKGTRVVVTGRLEQQQWEQDGKPRSKVILVVDEVAPSLRFATVTVHKTERKNNMSNVPVPADAF
jgi:single-strand DNA-binding protein